MQQFNAAKKRSEVYNNLMLHKLITCKGTSFTAHMCAQHEIQQILIKYQNKILAVSWNIVSIFYSTFFVLKYTVNKLFSHDQ